MLHHIALHCDATSGASMSPLGLYHIWVLSVLETLPYLYDTMSSGIIEIPDVALQCIAAPELHCIALQPQISPCSLSCIHVPYPAFISTWNSSLFEWYNVKRNHWDTWCCIALHCSPRYLHVPYPAVIKIWILSIFETLSYSNDNIFKSLWPCQPVQPFSKCESISSKVFDLFKPPNLDNLFKPVKRALTLFQRRTNFPHQRQLKPKLIVVKLSNQKSPTLSIFLHDKHRSFIMII